MKCLCGVCFLLRNPLSLFILPKWHLKANLQKKLFLFKCKFLPKINIGFRNSSLIFKSTFLAKAVKMNDHQCNNLITCAGGCSL